MLRCGYNRWVELGWYIHRAIADRQSSGLLPANCIIVSLDIHTQSPSPTWTGGARVCRFRFSVHSHSYYYGTTGPSSSEDHRERRRAPSYQRGIWAWGEVQHMGWSSYMALYVPLYRTRSTYPTIWYFWYFLLTCEVLRKNTTTNK